MMSPEQRQGEHVERGHEGVRPEITRPEWALSITCIALTFLTLATFVIAGRGAGGKKAPTKAVESSKLAARATSTAAAAAKRRVAPLPSADGRSPDVTVAPPPTASPVPTRPALAKLLVDVAPPGYVELTSGSGPSGAFDLEAFARASTHPVEDRAVLSQNGFRQGFVRSWEKSGANGTSRLVASVFEFADPLGAVALADYEGGRVVKEDAGVSFPVEGGSGLRFVHRQGDQTVWGYSVTLRRDEGLLFYVGALYSTPQSADEVLLVARTQLKHLRLQQPSVFG
jgi:hypothetical protein